MEMVTSAHGKYQEAECYLKTRGIVLVRNGKERTVAICIGIHDEHETILHLGAESYTDPGICRTGKVKIDIARVVCDID